MQIIFFYGFANFKNLVTSKGKVDRGGGGESGGGEGGGLHLLVTGLFSP